MRACGQELWSTRTQRCTQQMKRGEGGGTGVLVHSNLCIMHARTSKGQRPHEHTNTRARDHTNTRTHEHTHRSTRTQRSRIPDAPKEEGAASDEPPPPASSSFSSRLDRRDTTGFSSRVEPPDAATRSSPTRMPVAGVTGPSARRDDEATGAEVEAEAEAGADATGASLGLGGDAMRLVRGLMVSG